MRTLLAVECERNHYGIVALRKILEDFKLSPKKIYLERTIQGDILVGRVTTREYGTTGGASRVPKAHKTLADRYLLEAALLDNRLFSRLLLAYDALLELDWVSESLISHAETVISGSLVRSDEKDFFEEDHPAFSTEGYLEGFAEWGLEELDEAYTAINALYRACSGKTLETKRYL
ncbi:MAG: hypothetical protein ABSC06_27385 [Rhodopila sp.]|jgi:hypothetical protein